MAEAAAKKAQLTGLMARLTEDNVVDILLRLPAETLLRCRAVCWAWHSITTNPGFLADHARRQPADVVLYTYTYLPSLPPRRRRRGRPPSSSDDAHLSDVGLDVVPVSSDEAGLRNIMSYPKTHDWFFLASFDGVLLFKKPKGIYVLCNPITRQWAQLPRLPQAHRNNNVVYDREYAFYLHIPSGEYRLLCRRKLNTTGTWCILAAGAAAPRRVDMHAAEAAGITERVPFLRMSAAPHVALHGHLHWSPRQASISGQTEMVVFDMSLENFHLMAGPPTTTGMFMKLFGMDDEMLVAADFGKAEHIELWFLEDYGTRRWELRHRVATPWGSSGFGRPQRLSELWSIAAAGDREGNVMLGNGKGLVVYNMMRKTVKTADYLATSANNAVVSRHVFKESLMLRPGFVAAAQSSIDLSLIRY